jgi:endonuclease I
MFFQHPIVATERRAPVTRSLVLALLAIAVLAASAQAQAPPGYYTTVDASSAPALRATLHAVIDDHQRIPYTSSATDTWNVLELADEDPTNSSRILDLYKNAVYTKVNGGTGPYDREHTWPKSYGFPNDNASNYPYTDCHHLFLCDSGYNSSRNNKPYGICASGCTEKTTLVNAGQGGGAGVYPGNSNWTSGAVNSGVWETWSKRRGDVARALFYLDVRYEGGTHGVTGAAEPDLILTDDLALINASNTGANLAVAYMGFKSVLLQWHQQDPVDAIEMEHCNAVFGFQGNRNPFVDHPEWVDCLFGGVCSGGTAPATIWINEFHYDNAGSDVNEKIEVAGPAGTNLSGWKLIAYNGSNGASYATVNLSGTLPNQQSGYGTASFSLAGLQNGPPDGIALVNPSNQPVLFLSYEGAFTATNGPAVGIASTNVGVSESESTATTHSLQLGGTGNAYAEFVWQTPRTSTFGQKNSGQTFSN